MLHLAAWDTPLRAEIYQHGLALFRRRCEQLGGERLESQRLRGLTRIEQKCERDYRGNPNRRAEYQERAPVAALRRYEAEKNSGSGGVVGQYSRHQVVRYDWIEEIEREPNQHEA